MTFNAYDRIENARVFSVISNYVIKKFKIKFDQMLVLNWFFDFVRNDFQNYHAKLMIQWNLRVNHIDSCLFVTFDWMIVEFMIIAKLFVYEMISSILFDRLIYKFFDHIIILTRVIEWFEKWSKKKRDLNNFIECDKDNSMNESHICHHVFCIVHVCYERFDVNQNRKICYKYVIFLRQQFDVVSKTCNKHDSSCLMQISIHSF